jgi:hypothetical protein
MIESEGRGEHGLMVNLELVRWFWDWQRRYDGDGRIGFWCEVRIGFEVVRDWFG